MQTFLPYPDCLHSALVLDDKRLGKQRSEAKTILRTLMGEIDGWWNHPAVRMWHGSDVWLAYYGATVCLVWQSRGYEDALLPWFFRFIRSRKGVVVRVPQWWGDERFHLSHQSSLVRKDPDHYGPRFPGVSGTLALVWPRPRPGRAAPPRQTRPCKPRGAPPR